MPIPTAPPSGFRDFLPSDVALRADAAATIARVYRSFGFDQIATSAVEDLEVLTGKGGGENEKLIFKIMKRGEALERAHAAKENLADLGLRFDLTLPLARYFTKHGSTLPHPFKAFQMGPVWRAERAQKGRYREFTQCDVDIIGADSYGAEIDVITAILTVFSELGLSGVGVHINDRRLVDKALEAANVSPEKREAACVAIDKLDKVPLETVRAELAALVGDAAAKALEPLIASGTATGEKSGGATLDKISAAVKAAFPKAEIKFSPSLMRGMGYYTGPIFEFRHASLTGSLGGGGRYDRLTEKFGGHPIPACGGSIGFERLMLILEEAKKGAAQAGPDVCVCVFSEEMRGQALAAAAEFRAAGLRVDVFPGDAKLKAQFKYADQKKAAFAVVIGPDEAAKNLVNFKNLATHEETTLSLRDAVAKASAAVSR